jgi:transposase
MLLRRVPTRLPHNSYSIGIDVGLEAFATLSNGKRIENHRYYKAAQAKLRRAQRKVARRQNKKSENAGRQVVKVDPKNTSQECPNCHALEKKSLMERVHRCLCGLTIGRDHAAALVILGRGLRLQAQTDRHFATVA